MTRFAKGPSGPFHDSYGIGFHVPVSGGMLRNKTIARICWDGEGREAQFVNAAGLVVPCEPLPELPDLLRRAEVEVFGGLLGDGLFARKPAAVNAMKSSGTLRKWVVYRLAMPEDGYFWDDVKACSANLESRLQAVAADFDQEHRLGGYAIPGRPAVEASPDLLRERESLLQQRRSQLEGHRRWMLEKDRELALWLKGEWPAPPLLKGVAA